MGLRGRLEAIRVPPAGRRKSALAQGHGYRSGEMPRTGAKNRRDAGQKQGHAEGGERPCQKGCAAQAHRSTFPWDEPQRDVRGLHRLAHHRHQVVVECVEVGLVAQPRGERLEGLAGVVLPAVEEPVDEA